MDDLRPVFRRATLSDVEAIVALVERCYRGEASRAGWTTEADLLDGQRTDRQEVRALLEGPATRIVLAHAGPELVGCVMVKDEGDGAYLGMLSVTPARQSSGLGRAILAEAERVAREELARRTMRMRVLVQRDPLIAWYERRGYRRTGETEPFPMDDARFGLPKRDDLAFAVMKKEL